MCSGRQHQYSVENTTIPLHCIYVHWTPHIVIEKVLSLKITHTNFQGTMELPTSVVTPMAVPTCNIHVTRVLRCRKWIHWMLYTCAVCSCCYYTNSFVMPRHSPYCLISIFLDFRCVWRQRNVSFGTYTSSTRTHDKQRIHEFYSDDYSCVNGSNFVTIRFMHSSTLKWVRHDLLQVEGMQKPVHKRS